MSVPSTLAIEASGLEKSFGASRAGGLFAGLPRAARAALMGRGSTDVRLVTFAVTRENLEALAALLESGDVKVVVDEVYPLSRAADAVAHMLGHHARGKVVIAVEQP